MDVRHPSTGVVVAEFILGTVVAIALFLHADKNGSKHPTAWAFLSFLAPGPVVIAYLVHRRMLRRRKSL